MQRSTKSTVTVAALALAAFVTSFTAITAGQGAQAPPPPANTPPKPLVPVAAMGDADPVARPDDRCKVGDGEHRRGALVAAPQEGEHAVVAVIGFDPLEAGRFAVELMQRGHLAVDPVEVADQPLHAAMLGLVEQVPVQRMVVMPLRFLSELAAHE